MRVADRVDLIAWSDYLCPWCYNAAVRLERLEDALGDRVYRRWVERRLQGEI